MAEVESWITVNGVHIPIMKGESKARAVGNFIRSKRKEYNKKVVRKADKIVEDIDTRTGNFKEAIKKGTKYYEKHIDRPTIKGTKSGKSFSYKDSVTGEDVTVKRVKAKDGTKGVSINRGGHTEVYKTNKSIDEIRKNAGVAKNTKSYKLKTDKKKSAKNTKPTIKGRVKTRNEKRKQELDFIMNIPDMERMNRALEVYQRKLREDTNSKSKIYKKKSTKKSVTTKKKKK